MNRKHKNTPGPWLVCFFVPTASIPGHLIKADDSAKTPIGEVFGEVWSGCGSSRQIANAKLMAASPELLEACESALTFIQMGYITKPDKNDPALQVVKTIKTAIKKATK